MKTLTFHKKGFVEICKANVIYLYDWMERELIELYGKDNVISPKKDGYIYCKGNSPVMLVAHMDTVHKLQPEHIWISEKEDAIKADEGIGGDDRCGIYAIVEIITNLPKEKLPYLFFSTDEETGSKTTIKGVADLLANKKNTGIDNINFAIQIDRKGAKDSVYYSCGNIEFKNFIDSYGFKEAYGSYTDICKICPAFDIAGVNLSSGYYSNHNLSEYVVIPELMETINKVFKIIFELNNKKYNYCERKTTSRTYYNS